MRYEAFSRACRALGIQEESFRDQETLALSLEMNVGAGNAKAVVRLLQQLAADDFDIQEARRAFRLTRNAAWKIQAWDPIDDLGDCDFFLGETELLRRWLTVLPAEMRRSIVAFFDASPRRFMLAIDPFSTGTTVKLGVQDAAMELSYFLPARFILDPKKALETGRELLRHLRIGTLYHELLSAAKEGVDVGRILSLLAGDAQTLMHCPEAVQ